MTPIRSLLSISCSFFLLGFVCVGGFSPSSTGRSLLSRISVVSSPRTVFTTTVKASAAADDIDEVCTVQILMSDTGGGHRASANAIRDAFDVLYPGRIQCDIVDIYTDYGPFWPYDSYVDGYKFMAKHPWTWDLFYHVGSTDFGLCVNEVLLETFCFDAFTPCLARPAAATGKRADMVVSVHPLTQAIPLKILAALDAGTRDVKARTTPFCTVVTDLGSAHPTWFHPGVDKCFVPSDALNKFAQERGLKSDQIVQYGLPIRKGFWDDVEDDEESRKGLFSRKKKADDTPKEVYRESLGLDRDLPVVLVVGGGDGMGGIVEISKALGEKLGRTGTEATSQMVVVCGNNQEAKKTLEESYWGKGVKVYVQGFVNNMDEWMKASDALVTKAGPGTIAEASICGLPCMMFSYLPGQEAGNIPFVEDNGFGRYSADPKEIAETVSSWLASPEKLHKMQDAALAAARPHATIDIAKDLAGILFEAKRAKQVKTQTAVAAA